ncbi:uncharacterized protein LOC144231660 isoform X3 [Crocuta crocuta]
MEELMDWGLAVRLPSSRLSKLRPEDHPQPHHGPATHLRLRPGDLYRTFPGGPGPAFSCGLWLSCSWPRGSFRQQACAGRRQSWGAGLLRGQQSGGDGRQEPRDTGGTVVWLLLSCEVPPRSNRHPSR